MKMSAKMKKMLNDQIGMEGYASSYYLSMASWCDTVGYEGTASFFYAQSYEERQHMLKIVLHLNSIGAAVTIPAIKQPPKDYKSLEDLCKAALGNEQAVTVAFARMAEYAQKEGDYSTFAFLQWYVNEQVQEETVLETILQKFELVGRDKLALVEIDRIIGSMATKSNKADAT